MFLFFPRSSLAYENKSTGVTELGDTVAAQFYFELLAARAGSARGQFSEADTALTSKRLCRARLAARSRKRRDF